MALPEAFNQLAAPALGDFARQGAVYDGLLRTLEEGTFVHAYLISGLAGMGKRTLARFIAQYLLCTGEKRPCGGCPACVQVMEDQHPDVIIVQPGKPVSTQVDAGRKTIPVEDIRAVISITGRHTFEGGRRVVIIHRAEKMTPGAQNALLKTLEEPLEGTVFLLVTDAPELLLPTIVSRCRALKLHPWPDEVILQALARRGVSSERARDALHVCGGSIGQALAVATDEAFWQRRSDVMRDFFALPSRSDILRISTQWKDRKDDAEGLLSDVEDMLRSLLLVRLGQRDAETISAFPQPWQRMAKNGGLEAFVRLLDAVADARRLRSNQVTWQAVVERLLLRLMEEYSKWQT